MAKEQRIDIELLRDLAKSQNMPARILNLVSRRLETPRDKLTDRHLEESYSRIIDDVKNPIRRSCVDLNALMFKTLENYLLTKNLIDVPAYFAYLPILKHEPIKEEEHKSAGMAELVSDGSRTLVYPIGMFMPNGPTLHFGKSLDDLTELVSDLGNVHIKDIKTFRRLHPQIKDSYDGDDYIFRKTAIK